MTRRRTVTLGVLVMLLGVYSFASAQGRGMGLKRMTPAQEAYVRAYARQVRSVAPNALALARAQAEAGRLSASAGPMTLPSAVDNSARPQFPPIGDQGWQNSCTAFATAYYYMSYTQAMDEGYAIGSAGDLIHIMSPGFIYPLMNDGVDGGSSIEWSLMAMGQIGCATLTDKTWSDSDYLSWPSTTAWVNALNNRLGPLQYIEAMSPTAITDLKQLLANGGIATFGINVHDTWYSLYPNDTTGINNGVYYATDGAVSGGHALTLVGYDDNKSYVDHRDGLVHRGAFLVANSWGSWWGVTNTANKKGHLWIAYSLFQDPALWQGGWDWVDFTADRPHYRPALYALAALNYPERGNVHLYGFMDTPSTWYSDDTLSYYGGTGLPTADTDPIAVDLTDGLGYMAGSGTTNAGVAMGVWSEATGGDGTITAADFYADAGGDGSYTHVASTDPPVTVAPGAEGYATAAIDPLGIDYQMIGRDLPAGLVWDMTHTGAASVDLLNQSPTTWTAAGGYQLLAKDGINRWGFASLYADASIAPGEEWVPGFTLTGPPVSTLRYATPAVVTGPPVVDSLPADLVFSQGTTPLVGTGTTDEVAVARFPDVLPATAGAWASGEIQECAGNVPSLIAGYAVDNTFRPAGTLSRGQLAAFLQRALKLPLAVDDSEYHLTFTDMTTATPFWREIQAIVDQGLVGGYASDNTYRPTVSVNRGQLAQFLVKGYLNGADIPPYTGTPHFSDVPSSHKFYDAIEFGYANDLIKGYAGGTYRPDNLVNRGQMAVFLFRAFVQPYPSVVVLGGPAVTAQDPSTGGACGWASVASGPAAAPGYAYIAFDAVRMLDDSVAVGGTWDLTFELRDAATPTTPAVWPYGTHFAIGSGMVGLAVSAAIASGDPYYVISWPLPADLAPGDYLLVVGVEDRDGVMQQVARTPAFTITP